jgi:hypothetical protein
MEYVDGGKQLKKGSDILDFIKLNPKYLTGLVIASGVLLFTPIYFLDRLGITDLVDKYRIWIGLIFLITVSLLISHLIWHISNSIKSKLDGQSFQKIGKQRLKKLTPREKHILNGYINENERTQYLDYTDGSVRELELMKIIYRSSNLSRGGTVFAYNIQPWAWDYLNKHKKLLHSQIDTIL